MPESAGQFPGLWSCAWAARVFRLHIRLSITTIPCTQVTYWGSFAHASFERISASCWRVYSYRLRSFSILNLLWAINVSCVTNELNSMSSCGGYQTDNCESAWSRLTKYWSRPTLLLHQLVSKSFWSVFVANMIALTSIKMVQQKVSPIRKKNQNSMPKPNQQQPKQENEEQSKFTHCYLWII